MLSIGILLVVFQSSYAIGNVDAIVADMDDINATVFEPSKELKDISMAVTRENIEAIKRRAKEIVLTEVDSSGCSSVIPSMGNLLGLGRVVRDGWTSFSEVNNGFRIPRSGVIGKWEYKGASSSPVYLQVYRYQGGSIYKLIGENYVSSTRYGQINTVTVNKRKQITVRAGDYIGWTFVGVAAFAFASGGSTRWATSDRVSYRTIGGNFNFPGVGSRLYLVRATIGKGSCFNPTSPPTSPPTAKKTQRPTTKGGGYYYNGNYYYSNGTKGNSPTSSTYYYNGYYYFNNGSWVGYNSE